MNAKSEAVEGVAAAASPGGKAANREEKYFKTMSQTTL
jgi:hypothetical protein